MFQWVLLQFQQLMKIHYNSQSVATVRKLKSVISAVGAKVQEVTHKQGDDISKVSAVRILPVLETPEGTFFSSNTILRYLAASLKNSLYGGDNIFHKSLVDQWLDITTCDFQPAVRAVTRHQNNQKIDFGKLIEDINKFLAFVEKHLSEKKFLVGDTLSIADLSLASSVSVVFGVMFGEGQRKKYPNTLNWYNSVVAENKQAGSGELPKQAHESFRGGKKGGDKPQKTEAGKAKQGKPAEGGKKKEQKKEESDDLFGEEQDKPAKKPQAAPAPKPEAKKKQKPVAKSIVVFDIKVYEQETDLNQLFKKVKQITVDGLVWNEEPKILPVAFGMNKLQVGCVVQDAKVSLQDLYEKIEGYPQVQSTDTVSFQKL